MGRYNIDGTGYIQLEGTYRYSYLLATPTYTTRSQYESLPGVDPGRAAPSALADRRVHVASCPDLLLGSVRCCLVLHYAPVSVISTFAYKVLL